MSIQSVGHAYKGEKFTTIRVANAVYADRETMCALLMTLPEALPTDKDNAFWFDGQGKQTTLPARTYAAPQPAVVRGGKNRGSKTAAQAAVKAALRDLLGL